jgi:diketogulonate reductase-like aldo/keto reductase
VQCSKMVVIRGAPATTSIHHRQPHSNRSGGGFRAWLQRCYQLLMARPVQLFVSCVALYSVVRPSGFFKHSPFPSVVDEPSLDGKKNVIGATVVEDKLISYDTYPIAYGTRGGGQETSTYIRDAILEGFRHIVTGSHHNKHNETGAGEGWKAAVAQNQTIKRSDLFLQTMFVPFHGNDFEASPNDPTNAKELSIEDQVNATIEQSLNNLQTTYIDAVLFHNFRAKTHTFDDMFQAWRALEKYVKKGTIRFLGISNVHDAEYLTRLHTESKVKPVILQNRFHANRGFDVSLQHTVHEQLGLQVQHFWILTGNSGGRANRDTASEKQLTKEQLMLAFVMSLGQTTALVGTHSQQHMRDDLALIDRFDLDNDIFTDMYNTDPDRIAFAQKLGMKGYTTTWPKHTSMTDELKTAVR